MCAAVTDGACPDLDGDGTPDCNETAVMNAGFDTDKSQWIPDQGVTLSWDGAGDLNGKSGSGALVVTNTNVAQVSNWTMLVAAQCVPVGAGSKYDFATQLDIPAGQGPGSALLGISYYSTPDCTGLALDGGGLSPQVTATATCEVLQMSSTAPSGAAGATVRLTVAKAFAAPAFAVEFDNVLFKKH
jgi:hypothetical protein